MRQELKRFLKRFDPKSQYLSLLALRCPFDFMMAVYNANLLESFFRAIEQGDSRSIWKNFWLFLLAGGLLYLYNGSIWRKFAAHTAGMQMNMRTKVYEMLMRQPFDQSQQQTPGEWVTRTNRDTDLAYRLLGDALNLPHAAIAACNVILCGIVLARMDGTVFLISMMFMFPHILISLCQVARPMTRLSKDCLKELDELMNAVEPAVTFAADVKLYGSEDFLYQKMEESSTRLLAARMKIHRKKAWNQLLMPLFGMSGYLAIFLVGGSMITGNGITFGEVTKMIQYRGCMLMASMLLINSVINLRENYAGMKRMNERMEEQRETGGKEQPGDQAVS